MQVAIKFSEISSLSCISKAVLDNKLLYFKVRFVIVKFYVLCSYVFSCISLLLKWNDKILI